MARNTLRRVVLTGASRGLGRAMALGLARAGHTVFGCGRTRASLDSLAAALGPPHELCAVDVADDAAVARWASSILERHEAPDLLVNNAAVINGNAPLWQVSAAEFAALVDINIKGIANAVRHFVPAMIARGAGIIVNFSSGWGRSTAAEVAPYCATKWAVEGLSRALAQELPSGMACVPLNPGIIDTEMLRSCFGADAASYPSPDEWADRAVPLLLQLSGRDNGQALTVPS